MKSLKRFMGEVRGTIAVLFAVGAPLLLVIAGAAIDYNRALSARTTLQAALDTAILAAVVTDESSYASAFQDAFAAALALNGGELTPANVTVGAPQQLPDGTLTTSADACIETLIIRSVGIACLNISSETFAENDRDDGPSVVETASSSNPCVFFTEPNKYGLDMFNTGEFYADCVVHIRSNGSNRSGFGLRVQSGGVAEMNGICMPFANILNNGSLTPTSATPGCTHITDPFAGLQNPPTNGCDRQGTTVNAGQTVSFSPGKNCGQVRVRNGGTLVLEQGIHTFDAPFTVDEGGVMEGEDVMVVLKRRTDYTVNGELFLQGLRTGDYRGFTIFLEDHSGNSNRIRVGPNASFRADGVLYLPNTLFMLQNSVNEFATRSILVTDRFEVKNGATFRAVVTEPSPTPFPAAFSDGVGADEYDIEFQYNQGSPRLSYAR
ncbi:MAG: TadE/TadG family type IV pilus assembly protein [Parvularculaceae bacterium]